MKLKNFIVMFIIAPICLYLTWQILWFSYDLLDLFSVTVESYTNLTLGVSLLVFGLTFYKGYRLGPVINEQAFKKKVKKQKKKIDLNSDITIQDVTKTFRPSKKNALLEFIIIGDGKNLHQIVPFKTDASYKNGKTVYKVESANLTIQKNMFGRKKFIAIFKRDGTAIKVKGDSKTVTAEILSLAQRSGALGRTLKEMFSTHLNVKKILFFVVIGAAAVIIIYVVMGGMI